MALLLARIGGFRFLRYALASGGALVVDIVCFTALLPLEIPGMLAATIGYAAGILVHWFLSSRQVFTGTVAPAGRARMWQKSLFAVSALVGLGITAAIVGLGANVGIDPHVAKSVAIAASFFATWMIRSRIVFIRRTARDAVAG